MPGLFATLGMDARPYRAELEAIEKRTVAYHARVEVAALTSARIQVEALERQIIAYQSAGLATAELEKQLAVATAEYAAAGSAAIAAAEASSVHTAAITGTTTAITAQTAAINTAVPVIRSVAPAIQPIAPAINTVIPPALNLNAILARLLVIAGELARGQLARAFYSFTKLLQLFGMSIVDILKLGGVLGLIAVGAHAVYKGFKEMADGAEAAADRVGRLKAALESQISVMRQAAKEAADFQDWLKRLHEIGTDNSLTKAAEDQVKAMHHAFEMAQKIERANARARGDTPEQMAHNAAEAQKIEARKEQQVFAIAAEEAKDRADEAEAVAVHTVNRPDIQREQDRVNTGTHAGEVAGEQLAALLAEFGDQTSGPALWRAAKSNTLPALLSSFGAPKNQQISFDFKGHQMTATRAQLEANLNSSESNLAVHQGLLDTAQRNLEEKKSAAERARRDATNLVERAHAGAETVAALDEVDDAVAERAKKPDREKREGLLTANQRIGAYIGPAVSLVDVTRGIARDVRRIAQHADRNQREGAVRSNGVVEQLHRVSGFD